MDNYLSNFAICTGNLFPHNQSDYLYEVGALLWEWKSQLQWLVYLVSLKQIMSAFVYIHDTSLTLPTISKVSDCH